MKFGPVPVSQAEGKVLAHNIPRPEGHGVLRKGKALGPGDVADLTSAGVRVVYVAALEAGDVDENEGARQVAEAAAGNGLLLNGPSEGRANLAAVFRGVLQLDARCLDQVNACEGVTFATLPEWSLVEAGQNVATVKIIPYALSSVTLKQAVRAASRREPLIQVHALKARKVGLVFFGLPSAIGRVESSFEAPLRRKVEALGSTVTAIDPVPLDGTADEDLFANVLLRQAEDGAELIVLAGDTSTMDRNDIAPRAVVCAGGQVTCIGAPVEPGNLMMLGRIARVPVLGVPGCARSRHPTVVDKVLPVLLSGVRLSAVDVARLGHGGLMEHANHHSP